jgi:hypothetical protein
VAQELSRSNDLPIGILIYKNNHKLTPRILDAMSQPDLLHVVNQNFLFIRLEEKELPLDLRFQYDIRSVPTFLFVDANGVELDRLVGYTDEEKLDKDMSTIARKLSGLTDMRREYISRKSENEFLKKYYYSLVQYGFQKDADRLVSQYFSNLNEEETIDQEFVLESCTHYRLTGFNYVLDHLTEFDEKLGYQNVTKKLCNAVTESLPKDRVSDLVYIRTRMNSIFPNDLVDRFFNYYIISTYSESNDPESLLIFIDHAEKELAAQNCSHEDWYNDIVVSLMMKNKDEAYLNKLAELVHDCIEQNGSINSMDILSVIKYKLGLKDESFSIMNDAKKKALDQGMLFKSSLAYFKSIGFLQ